MFCGFNRVNARTLRHDLAIYPAINYSPRSFTIFVGTSKLRKMQRVWGTAKTRRFSPCRLTPQPPYIPKLNGVILRPFSNQNYTTPFLINNEEIISSKTFDVRNPCDSKKLWSASAATLSDVEKVTRAAAAAFPSWSTMKLVKRRELLLKFGDILQKRSEDLKKCMCIETAARLHGLNLIFTRLLGLFRRFLGC